MSNCSTGRHSLTSRLVTGSSAESCAPRAHRAAAHATEFSWLDSRPLAYDGCQTLLSSPLRCTAALSPQRLSGHCFQLVDALGNRNLETQRSLSARTGPGGTSRSQKLPQATLAMLWTGFDRETAAAKAVPLLSRTAIAPSAEFAHAPLRPAQFLTTSPNLSAHCVAFVTRESDISSPLLKSVMQHAASRLYDHHRARSPRTTRVASSKPDQLDSVLLWRPRCLYSEGYRNVLLLLRQARSSLHQSRRWRASFARENNV
jgi:hypothetical protein